MIVIATIKCVKLKWTHLGTITNCSDKFKEIIKVYSKILNLAKHSSRKLFKGMVSNIWTQNIIPKLSSKEFHCPSRSTWIKQKYIRAQPQRRKSFKINKSLATIRHNNNAGLSNKRLIRKMINGCKSGHYGIL